MRKLLLVICMLSTGSLCWAQATAPTLGTAATFAVLGGSNVTCTAPGVISGDVGVSPGVFTNTTGCLVVGTVHQGDVAATNALTDLNTAYTNALVANSSCTSFLAAAPGASFTLAPGVYCNTGAAPALTLTTITLTLDAGGNANAVWIFKIDAALTGTGFKVVMANGGQPCNVYWLVGADSTLTTSTFQGNILAGGPTGSFTSTGGTLIGRVLANGAVTLTGPNLHGTCALAAQGGAGCKNDDDDRDHEGDDEHGEGKRHHKDHHDKDDKDHRDDDRDH
jgi:Ice-binding-like